MMRWLCSTSDCWADILQEQGYRRVDGTYGFRDLATGLPRFFGGAKDHPLQPSLLAHSHHGQRFRISGDRAHSNVRVELWMVNGLRSSHRSSSLLALVTDMPPILQD